MRLEVKIDESAAEPRVIVVINRVTEEVEALLRKLSEEEPRLITGVREGRLQILEPSDLYRVYASGGRVYAVTDAGEFTLRARLYELEERLDRRCFVRISNSEIVNLKKVKSFDLNLAGMICVIFSDGGTSYVSRRYVSKIKQVLGV